MQYENNLGNALRVIIRKLNLLSATNKVDNHLKIKGQKLGQNPQKAHLHPLKDVCMQYESNPANSSRDIVRKRNMAAQPYCCTARHGDDNIPRPYFLGGG